MRSYIPLNSLRAFEAAARLLSFTKASRELNVTHAAISQQVKALEQHLKCQLFIRISRGLMLTAEGESLLPILNESFDRIANTLDRFAGGQMREKMKIGVVGTFAIGWLLAHLQDFRRLHPHIDLLLSTHNNHVDSLAEGLDYAIRYGNGAWHGTESHFLCDAPLSHCAARRWAHSCTLRAICIALPCCDLTAAMSGQPGFLQPVSVSPPPLNTS